MWASRNIQNVILPAKDGLTPAFSPGYSNHVRSSMGRPGVLTNLTIANRMKSGFALTTFSLLSCCIPWVGCNIKNDSASRDFEKKSPCDSQMEVEILSFCGDIVIAKSELPETSDVLPRVRKVQKSTLMKVRTVAASP